MSDDSIPKQVLQNLGQIVEETGKEAVKQAGEVTTAIITGKQLLGDLTPMSGAELERKKAEDEQRKKLEAERLKQQMGAGRNVEQEISQVRQENKQIEDEKQQQLLQEIQAKRQAEEQERIQMEEMWANMSPKHPKGPQGPASGKKKKSQPDPSSMSATSEFKGKVD